LKLLPKLLKVKSVKEYLALSREASELGGVRGVFACFAKVQGEKALKILNNVTSSWEAKIKTMEDVLKRYTNVVEEYAASWK